MLGNLPVQRMLARTDRFESRVSHMNIVRWSLFAIAMVLSLLLQPARADVALRVQAQPVTDPIQAFVTVTDANGDPVGGLTGTDFTVLVDGVALATAPTFSLPPGQNPGQHVSVVFAMDYSPSVTDTSRTAMEQAVVDFINAMQVGDYAAIVKFNGTNANKASVVQAFTRIDGGAGTAALVAAARTDYPGRESNILDAIVVSVGQFTAPPVPLPAGPRAILLLTDGAENGSTADINTALQGAIDANISVFAVGVGDFSSTTSQRMLNTLTSETSGEFFPTTDSATIAAAYVQISELLSNEYLLSFTSSITDCNSHTIEVRVTGQAAATTTFTRCTPLFVPDLEGKTVAEATTALAAINMTVGTQTQQASTSPIGTIIRHTPSLGAPATPGGTVAVVISSGVVVPNVVGLSEADARTSITSAVLAVGTVTRQTSTTVASGLVISQTPANPNQVASGTRVDLVVSSGPPAPPSGGGSSGGGGGAFGALEMLCGLMLAGLLRRRRRT